MNPSTYDPMQVIKNASAIKDQGPKLLASWSPAQEPDRKMNMNAERVCGHAYDQCSIAEFTDCPSRPLYTAKCNACGASITQRFCRTSHNQSNDQGKNRAWDALQQQIRVIAI